MLLRVINTIEVNPSWFHFAFHWDERCDVSEVRVIRLFWYVGHKVNYSTESRGNILPETHGDFIVVSR